MRDITGIYGAHDTYEFGESPELARRLRQGNTVVNPNAGPQMISLPGMTLTPVTMAEEMPAASLPNLFFHASRRSDGRRVVFPFLAVRDAASDMRKMTEQGHYLLFSNFYDLLIDELGYAGYDQDDPLLSGMYDHDGSPSFQGYESWRESADTSPVAKSNKEILEERRRTARSRFINEMQNTARTLDPDLTVAGGIFGMNGGKFFEFSRILPYGTKFDNKLTGLRRFFNVDIGHYRVIGNEAMSKQVASGYVTPHMSFWRLEGQLTLTNETHPKGLKFILHVESKIRYDITIVNHYQSVDELAAQTTAALIKLSDGYFKEGQFSVTFSREKVGE